MLHLAADPGTPGTFYAVARPGVFKSVDSARSWRWSGLGLPSRTEGIEHLAVDPDRSGVVYAAYPDGLFRSQDGGGHWSLVLPCASPALAVGPGRTVLVAAGPVYRSADGGDTWSVVLAPAEPIGIVRADPSGSGTVYAVTGRGRGTIFKSLDGGVTWSLLSAPGNPRKRITALLLAPSRPATLYLQVGMNLYASDDGGAHWSLRSRIVSTALAVDPADPEILYAAPSRAGVLGLVLASHDGGRRWQRVDEGLPLGKASSPPSVAALVFDPFAAHMLYAATSLEGVLRLDTGEAGGRWEAAGPQHGLTAMEVLHLGFDPAHPNTIYIRRDSRPPLVSRDGGRSWGSLAPALERVGEIGEVAFDPTEPPALYAVAGGYLWRSFTGGATWTRRCKMPWKEGVLAFSGKRRLVNGALGIRLSTDGGRTWTTTLADRTEGDPDTFYWRGVDNLTSVPGEPSTLYARVEESYVTDFHDRLYRSLDGGATWSRLLADLDAMALDPARPSGLYVFRDLVLWQSLDRGESWREVGRLPGNDPSLYVSDLLVDPAAPSILYAATGQGVLRSTDGGAHWAAVNAGLARQHRLSIEALVAHPADPHRIFAIVSDGGIFEARFSAPEP